MKLTSAMEKSNSIHNFFHYMTHNPLLTFLIPFLIVLIGRFIIFNDIKVPEPLIQDEFSYLLAGDTFASFRMTNPMHPFWEHFETIHLLVKPTYMSKYPPMQGLLLAVGQLLFGQPWVAIVLSMAIFCGLLCWTFRAWVPAEWAMVGALVATYKIGIISYWTDSYWGGSIAAIGGALLLGSIKRLVDRQTTGLVFVFSIGSIILINSRPFEGLIFLIGCSIYLFYQLFGQYKTKLPILAKKFLIPAFTVVIPAILLMGLYNYRVTGHITTLPYTEYDKQYAAWSPFFSQRSEHTPLYRLDFIKRTWLEWDAHTKLISKRYPVTTLIHNFHRMIKFYFGDSFYLASFFLIIMLIFGKLETILHLYYDETNRAILFLLFFYIFASSIILNVLPHYTAPAAALTYLAIIIMFRALAMFSYRKIPVGKICCLTVCLTFIFLTTQTLRSENNIFLFPKSHFLEKRTRVLNILNALPRLQLVFVNQGRNNDPNEIWVFNRADIDTAKIVWANDISPEKNQRLIDYYHHQRQAWKLNDDAELTLVPYNNQKAQPLVKIKNPKPPIL